MFLPTLHPQPIYCNYHAPHRSTQLEKLGMTLVAYLSVTNASYIRSSRLTTGPQMLLRQIKVARKPLGT